MENNVKLTDESLKLQSDIENMIAKFEKKLSTNLDSLKFKDKYNSIDDILEKKFNIENIDEKEFPDFKDKLEFVVTAVRGNIQKAKGNILSYTEADKIIETALTEELPY